MYAFKTDEGVGFSRRPFGEKSVELTDEEHAALILGQSSESVITWNPKGKPYLADRIFTAGELAISERAWRNAELQRADIELNKLSDLAGDVAPWREYRQALRAWPESINFPSVAHRPTAPDIEVKP